MKIAVCSPSYKRPQDLRVPNYLPFVRVYVDRGEHRQYREGNPRAVLVQMKDGVQGNVSRVRNYILRREFKAGADVVVIVDDDLSSVSYWEGKERHRIEADAFHAFIERYTLLAKELGVKMWGVNLNRDKQNYREYTPFSMTSPILGPFQCFLKGNSCFYDERLFLKEDYDMTIQQMHRYRKVLRLNKYFYECKQSEQPGGCATQRNMRVEREQFELLQGKWGDRIVQRDYNERSHNRKRRKKHADYNPVIWIPIKGI